MKVKMFDEKLSYFEREKKSKYVEEEEQRIFHRASLAKQRLALQGIRDELDKKDRELQLREQHLEERSRTKALNSIKRTLEAVEEREESMQLREVELQQWEASMLYGNGSVENEDNIKGGKVRISEEENRSKRIELINRIGKLQSKIVKLESEKEELKNKSSGKNALAKKREAGGDDALELHEREKKLEMWAETLKRQQKNLDDESLSLANDLKSLKDREERLLRITDNALQDDSLRKSQRVDGNTLMNSSLDNSWSNALGLEE